MKNEMYIYIIYNIVTIYRVFEMNKIVRCINNVENALSSTELKDLLIPYIKLFDGLKDYEKREISLQVLDKTRLIIPISITSSDVLFKAGRKDEFTFLSNFWPHVKYPEIAANKYKLLVNDLKLHISDKVFFSSEHYFQYKKYLIIDQYYADEIIYKAKNSVDVKMLSGKLKYIEWVTTYPLQSSTYLNTKYIRTKASSNRLFDERMNMFRKTANKEMMIALYNKFTSDIQLKNALLSTVGLNIMEQGRMSRDYWAHTGKNMLGKMLIYLRFALSTQLSMEEYIETFTNRYLEDLPLETLN